MTESMREPWAQAEIVVARPPDEVFAFLTDGRNEPLWNPLGRMHDIKMVEAPGHTFLEWFGGHDEPYAFEAFLEPAARGATLVRARLAVTPRGPLARVVRAAELRAELKRALDAVRRAVESSFSRGPRPSP